LKQFKCEKCLTIREVSSVSAGYFLMCECGGRMLLIKTALPSTDNYVVSMNIAGLNYGKEIDEAFKKSKQGEILKHAMSSLENHLTSKTSLVQYDLTKSLSERRVYYSCATLVIHQQNT